MAAASYTIAPSICLSVTSVIRSVRHTHRHDVTEPRKSTKPRRSRGRRKPKPSKAAAPLAATPTPEPATAPPEPRAEPAPEIEFANPEFAFAARAAARPPEPERPFPTSRRAIFFDVENTSRPQHIARVIDYLSVDRLGRRTDFVAVGNWRVIGHDTARLLAGHGAQLLHSAPSVGVKDWSDLRIAVAAGVWLGTARPGDILEILSDDRAFDAVGDVATSLGISFRRLSYRGLTGLPREAEPIVADAEPRAEPSSSSRRRRGRRGGYGGRREMPSAHAAPQPAARQVAPAEPHTAPHDELLGVARDLIRVSPGGAVTLDTLANALKGRGFSRTPGSPRLITRLRRIRELTVSRSGHITLVDPHSAAQTPVDAEPLDAESAEIEPMDVEPVAPAPEPPPRPSSRDDRSLDERRAEVEAAQRLLAARTPAPAPAPAPAPISVPAPAPPSEGPQDDGYRRRRSRRGGRRHRRHIAPAAG
jgi:hypothetical protein